MVIAVYLAIILFSVMQSATTKLFNRRSSNSSLFNSIKAISSLALFAIMAVSGFTFHLPTLLFGLLYGGCLCVSMYSGYKALCLGPMALTSMLVSFSILIPLLWGVLFEKEVLAPLHVVGLLILFGTIILTNADKLFQKRQDRVQTQKGTYGVWLLFVGITFLCNGVCSILQKQHQSLFPEAYSGEFMLFAMLFCTLIFSAVTLLRNAPSDIKQTKGKWLGVLSGIANGLANFFTLTLAGFENASILFPVISAGTLLGAILCGKLLFREKLKLNHYIALVCGMLSVILLKL